MTYSRRVKRLRAGWEGICRIEGEPGERRCRIDDISMLGIGVTFTQSSPSQLAGRRISVDVPAMARLEGQITHAERFGRRCSGWSRVQRRRRRDAGRHDVAGRRR